MTDPPFSGVIIKLNFDLARTGAFMASAYCKKLAKMVEAEFDGFAGYHETTSKMAQRIKTYWTGIGQPFTGVGIAWSAVFVSYFVKTAGANKDEFTFSAAHAQFFFDAIANGGKASAVFWGRHLTDYAPKMGDIIQNNRDGNTFDFDYAKTHSSYFSHSAIVVEEGVDGTGRYVRTIGGNESDTVGQRIVRLASNGKIIQPKADPARFISIIETRK